MVSDAAVNRLLQDLALMQIEGHEVVPLAQPEGTALICPGCALLFCGGFANIPLDSLSGLDARMTFSCHMLVDMQLWTILHWTQKQKNVFPLSSIPMRAQLLPTW